MKKLNTRNFLLICSLFLVSCATTPEPIVTGTLNIYQPPILSLEKGTEVNTKEGKYTAQTDEVWHSDKRYRDLERKGY